MKLEMLLRGCQKNVSFTDSFASAEKANTAIMVRFADKRSTDNVGYSIVVPEDITVMSNP